MAAGSNALASNTSGAANTAVGGVALENNTTGNSNVAIGSVALNKNITGIQNVALGSYSLVSNTTGNHNVGVGNLANYYNQAGSENTMIGYEAGGGTTLHSKSGNVFIGYPLTIYTAAAVQELKTENEFLKQEINELKKDMAMLMNSLVGGIK